MFVNIFDMIDNVGQGQTSYLTPPNFWECANMFMDFGQNHLKIHEIPTSKNPRIQETKN